MKGISDISVFLATAGLVSSLNYIQLSRALSFLNQDGKPGMIFVGMLGVASTIRLAQGLSWLALLFVIGAWLFLMMINISFARKPDSYKLFLVFQSYSFFGAIILSIVCWFV
jgi:high-affinity Fe2+/Pb2+ permease